MAGDKVRAVRVLRQAAEGEHEIAHGAGFYHQVRQMDNLNSLVPALSRDRQKHRTENYLKRTPGLRGGGKAVNERRLIIGSDSNLTPGKQKLPFAKPTAPRVSIHLKVRIRAVASNPAGSLPPRTPLYLSGCSHPASCGT